MCGVIGGGVGEVWGVDSGLEEIKCVVRWVWVEVGVGVGGRGIWDYVCFCIFLELYLFFSF